jgi:hypothetical protein
LYVCVHCVDAENNSTVLPKSLAPFWSRRYAFQENVYFGRIVILMSRIMRKNTSHKFNHEFPNLFTNETHILNSRQHSKRNGSETLPSQKERKK